MIKLVKNGVSITLIGSDNYKKATKYVDTIEVAHPGYALPLQTRQTNQEFKG